MDNDSSTPTAAGPVAAKQHIRKMPVNWWLKKPAYLRYMVREITCLFVGGYAMFLLMLAARLDKPEAFKTLLASPLAIGLQWVALPFAIYHSVTWFNLTPKVLVIWRGEDKLPGFLIAGAHYAGWLVVSAGLIYFAMSGGTDG